MACTVHSIGVSSTFQVWFSCDNPINNVNRNQGNEQLTSDILFLDLLTGSSDLIVIATSQQLLEPLGRLLTRDTKRLSNAEGGHTLLLVLDPTLDFSLGTGKVSHLV